MNKGETLSLSDISLRPDDISHIHFGRDKFNNEALEINFIEIPKPAYTILPGEFESIKEFAEVNNLVGNVNVRWH